MSAGKSRLYELEYEQSTSKYTVEGRGCVLASQVWVTFFNDLVFTAQSTSNTITLRSTAGKLTKMLLESHCANSRFKLKPLMVVKKN